MNRKLLIVLAASALYAAALNMRMQGLSASHMERSLTRRIGAYGHLTHAPTYFDRFEYEEDACKKCEQPRTQKVALRRTKRHRRANRKYEQPIQASYYYYQSRLGS